MSGAVPASTNGAGPAEEPAQTLRLGGMALRNGLLIHGPTAWAVAARTPDGRIEVASGSKPSLARGRLGRTPLLRGPLRLAEALTLVPLVRSRLSSARLPFEDRTVLVATIAGTAISAALRRRLPATVGRELAIAALGTIPALAALRDPNLAAYHGVEHKAIGGYEVGADPESVPKEHERCGSNLIAPMLVMSVAGQLLVERLLHDPGPVPRGLAALAGIGAAVELFSFAEHHPDSALGRAVHGPGHEIQRLVSTREPTPEQLEVGREALGELLRAESVAADSV